MKTRTRSSQHARPAILGCIADDVTGATDLAINLVKGGMRVVQWLGIPQPVPSHRADAIVIALKTRSIPARDAVAQSLLALESLQGTGCQRFFFKYCSTFDSTPAGNIGPVAEALLDALQLPLTVFCPAFPQNHRTVYQGHLFVGQRLLSESGMERHPLNPMSDANLVRVLTQQSSRPVGLLDYARLRSGPADVVSRLQQLQAEGTALVLTDACDDDHLQCLARGVAHLPLVTGGSGIGRYLPAAYRELGLYSSETAQVEPPRIAGRSLVLAGSCSSATARQVERFRSFAAYRPVDIESVMSDPERLLGELLQWVAGVEPSRPLMVYSTAKPEQVVRWQQRYGTEAVAEAVERFLAAVARSCVDRMHVRRLVVAGGETAGAVVEALGVRVLRIGPEICPGVPWTEAVDPQPLAIALKSGNFGDDDFFRTALRQLS